MIGGGEYQNFYAQGQLDSMLFVRWAQIACLMPVMQFSAAPWRVLEEKELAQVKESVALRQKWMSVLREAWMDCVRTGEPILRPMVYCFPQDDCAAYTDQFMIGNTLLVAPILRKGATARMVYLPKGEWQFENKRIRSEGMRVQVTINEHKCPFVFQRIHEDFSSSISNLA